ncbi:MAG: DNRLRE domain-containing protein, partial [Verrucomicrobia bacterium]|nr:DNRLRE domain-containing protein [Verrucomicrobiota bacterium]
MILTPAADTTLHQKFPDHNIGSHFDFAAGGVGSGERTRALLRFDLNGKVPTGATIQSASLALRVTRQPSSGGVDSAFELHRVNQTWTEGTQTSSSGQPAAPGESTWNARINPGIPWSAAGGVIGNDFGADVSASIDVTGRGAYTFASTPTLVRDVQFWLEEPNSNFGWVLLSRDENKPETARRFASREDPANTPMLTIEFTTGSNELRLTAINFDSSQVTLSWIGGIGPFQAQGKPSLSLPWEDIGTPVTTAPVALPLFGRMGFFRIRQATNVPGSPPPGSTNTPPAEPPPPPLP